MKLFRTTCFVHAKPSLAIALCTALAISVAQADDQKSSQNGTSQSTTGLSQTQSRQSQEDAQGGAGSATGAQSGSSSQLSKQDQKFIKEAAMGGKAEQHMGKLGVEKASNEQVKQFAQRLIDDHKKANQELKQLASSKGITMPSDATTPGQESDRTRVREQSDESKDHQQHHAMMQKLEGLSGAEFDREFVRMAVQHHEKDVKEFEKAALRAEDPEVKAYAQKTAPILREHLQQAKSLQSQVGGGSSGTGAPGSSSGSSSSGSGSSQGSGSTDAHTGEPRTPGSTGNGTTK